VIAPRHPERGEVVAARLTELGFRLARRRAGETPGPDVEIYLADTLGELGLFYRLARAAFIGKSLVPLGGQNPLEATRLGCPVLFGPHMANFVEIAGRLVDAGAAVEVANTAELAMTLDRLFGDAQARTRMARAGEALANSESGALDAVLAALAPLLDGKSHARA
jgi:3-deoxy-D-manno-octulosonic-acid transferase